MKSHATSSFAARPAHLRTVAWRPWPGTEGPASLEGAISGITLGAIDDARIVVEGAGVRHVIPVRGARFALDGLVPGSYRIELRMPRLVLARRLELPVGHHFIAFEVRSPALAHRRAA